MKTKTLIAGAYLLLFSLMAQGQKPEYYISKKINVPYITAIEKLKIAFKEEGFGVISERPMHKSLKKKLPDIEMKPYIVFGLCNAKLAHAVLLKEPNIGLFLPCKVVVKYISDSSTEIVAINPATVMKTLGFKEASDITKQITKSFESAMDKLQ